MFLSVAVAPRESGKSYQNNEQGRIQDFQREGAQKIITSFKSLTAGIQGPLWKRPRIWV